MDQLIWDDAEGDEDDEDRQSYEGPVASRDGMIFLVDATEPMFEAADDDTESPFEISIRCVRNTLTNKIISNYRDLVGLVLFGTEKDKNGSDFKHIYIHQDLGETGVEAIEEVEKLLDCKKKDFEKEFGHSDKFSISDALWTCSQIFANVKARLGSMRVLIFTCEDDPHKDNPQLQKLARAKAKDLRDFKIDVDLMHIQKKGSEFNVKKFYGDIIFFSDVEDREQLPDPAIKFEQLMKRVRHREHKRRALGRLRWQLGRGVEMGISLFNLVRSATRPSTVKLERRTNEELNSMRRSYLGDTGAILMPSDITMYQEYAGKKIYVETEEVKEIKSCCEPGLLLMGFKPLSSMKVHLHVRPSQFIYPDEASVRGSTTLFGAVHQQCLTRKVVALCRFMPRVGIPPRLVMLVPQEEEKDEDGIQTMPCGFHLFFIPYAEDSRHLELGPKLKPSVEMVEKAKDFIKKLQFNFHPDNFENPVLQKHWRNIEALALNRDEPDDMTDYTLPNHKTMEKRAGALISEFRKMVFPKGVAESSADKKRSVTSQGGGTSKRAKASDVGAAVDVKREAELGQLGKLTVSVMKEFCKAHGIKSGTKKADIIQAINEYLALE